MDGGGEDRGLEEELAELTGEEREQIMNVLQKNYLLQQLEQDRIKKLREVTCGAWTNVWECETSGEDRCFICSRRFLRFLRNPTRCSKCNWLVCQRCNHNKNGNNIPPTCLNCAKKTQYKCQSLFWFYNRVNSKFKVDAGTKVIKSLCARHKQGSTSSDTISSQQFLTNKYFRSLEDADWSGDWTVDDAMQDLNLRLSTQESQYLQTSEHLRQSASTMMSLEAELQAMESQVEWMQDLLPSLSHADDETDVMSSSWLYKDATIKEEELVTSHVDSCVTSETAINETAFQPQRKLDSFNRQICDSTLKIMTLESQIIQLEETIHCHGNNPFELAKHLPIIDKCTPDLDVCTLDLRNCTSVLEERTLNNIVDVEIEVLKLSLDVKISNKEILNLHEEILKYSPDQI